MDMGGMDMGSMSMNGMPPLGYFQKIYWAVVGAAIAVGFLVNVSNYVSYWSR